MEWTPLALVPAGRIEISIVDCDVYNVGGQFIVRRDLPDGTLFLTTDGAAHLFATPEEACAAAVA